MSSPDWSCPEGEPALVDVDWLGTGRGVDDVTSINDTSEDRCSIIGTYRTDRPEELGMSIIDHLGAAGINPLSESVGPEAVYPGPSFALTVAAGAGANAQDVTLRLVVDYSSQLPPAVILETMAAALGSR